MSNFSPPPVTFPNCSRYSYDKNRVENLYVLIWKKFRLSFSDTASGAELNGGLDTVLNRIGDIENQLRQTNHQLSKMTEMVSSVSSGSSQDSTRKTQAVQEDKQILLRSARSISSIQRVCTHLVTNPGRNVIYCDACVRDLPEDDGRKMVGVFAYDFQLGTDFPPSTPLPKQFTNLKTNIQHHLKSHIHIRKEAEAVRRGLCDKLDLTEMNTVAERVLRVAYYVLKNSLSAAKFEEILTILHLAGCNVGDKNHSAKMLEKARDEFEAVMRRRITAHVRSQPCVSVMVDKTTLNHRTVDITAIGTIDPEAPDDHMLQTMVIGAPVVVEHDGDAIAREILSTLASVGVTSPSQVAAMAADGQYHHARVTDKLSAAMGARRPLENTERIPAVWDGSHLLNLAERDALNKPTSKWVQDTVQRVTSITKHFTFGQGYEELLASSEKGKAAAPRLWSETRFAAHAAKVFRGFWHNRDAMEKVLKGRLSKARGVAADDMLRDLLQLRGGWRTYFLFTAFVRMIACVQNSNCKHKKGILFLTLTFFCFLLVSYFRLYCMF